MIAFVTLLSLLVIVTAVLSSFFTAVFLTNRFDKRFQRAERIEKSFENMIEQLEKNQKYLSSVPIKTEQVKNLCRGNTHVAHQAVGAAMVRKRSDSTH